MKILLTGATGFIGRRVLPLLSGHNVLCLTRTNFPEVAAFGAETVIHLAWPGVYGNDRYREEVQRDGYNLTRRLFAAVTPACRRWVGAGSQAEFTQRSTPYAIYKRWSLMATHEWALRHRVGFAWARLYSVYGPGEVPDSFLPYLIRELLAGRDPALTDQNLPWDFLFVDDAARALVALALGKATGLYEIAAGETIYTQDAARIVRDKVAPAATLRFGARPRRAVEIDGIGPVNVAPMRALGWSPQVSFSAGLDALIESLIPNP